MSRRQRTAVGLVVAALVLGAAGDVLFHGRPLGVNAGLFAAGFVLALAVLLRVGAVPLHQGRRYMVAPLLLFAALFAWHDSRLLVATNLLAIAGAVTLGALRRTERPVTHAEVADYLAGAAAAGAATFAGALELMERDLPWERLNAGMRGERAAAIGRGLAIGFPFLLVFGGLFIAADAVFRSLLESAVPNWRHFWSHALLALGLAWLSAGLLRDLLAAREDERLVAAPVLAFRARRGIGTTETAAALALVDLLFLAFVLVQLRYLFGGHGLVESRVHLTYAQYARHGFFELLAVSLLVFPLLLGADYLTRGTERRARLVRVLSLALDALNPDALIARTNLDRPKIDVAYVSRLSADAVPTLLLRLPSLAPEVRRPIAAALLRRSTREDGWLAWNAARSRADALLRERRTELELRSPAARAGRRR